ncbi:MAG: hypothetical protein J2P24_19460 [Streptosporangiales bacterium]|nr:hypothetical protein [Streptosporangiales bacterium]
MTDKPLWPTWPLLVVIGGEIVLVILAAILRAWLLAAGTLVVAVTFSFMYMSIRRKRNRR